MTKNYFHSVLALLLILLTTEFMWYEQISEDKSPVEQTEADAEEKSELREGSESSRKNEHFLLDLGHSFLATESLAFNFQKNLSNGYIKFLGRNGLQRKKLYLLFSQLKIDAFHSLG